MLIQMDGSYHPWLGDQAPPFTLLIAVDDATGQVVSALFCEHGVPRQLYLPVGVNQFCRFTSLAWPRCWAALVR